MQSDTTGAHSPSASPLHSEESGAARIHGGAKLDFYKAMEDFKGMFPEIEDQVIENILRANRGAVDPTIDQLLQMQTDMELKADTDSSQPTRNGGTERPAAAAATTAASSATTTAAATAAGTRQRRADLTWSADLFDPFATSTSSTTHHRSEPVETVTFQSSHRPAVQSRWRPAILRPLPRDFLRPFVPPRTARSEALPVPGRQRPTSTAHRALDAVSPRPTQINSGTLQFRLLQLDQDIQHAQASGDTNKEQLLEDERLALLLQNQEFLIELKGNADFMNALRTDTHEQRGHSGQASGFRANNEAPLADGRTPDDEATFRSQLRNMGKRSRRLFSDAARRFVDNTAHLKRKLSRSGQHDGGSVAGPFGSSSHDRSSTVNLLSDAEGIGDDSSADVPVSHRPYGHRRLVEEAEDSTEELPSRTSYSSYQRTDEPVI